MKTGEYLQSDDFATMEYQDKVDYLSKKSPTFKALDPTKQREYIFTRTKQPQYKEPDIASKAMRYGIPLATQMGGEAVGAAGGGAVGTAIEPGIGTLAGVLGGKIAGGSAGSAGGETLVDFIDYLRKMGPRPSLRGEMERTPNRMKWGAVGSTLGAAAPRIVNPKTTEGLMEKVLQNPKLYTRELAKGDLFKKGTGTEEAIGKASTKGEESVAKYEAEAQNKVFDAKKALKEHWNKKQYGDPVTSEFEPKGPEPVEPAKVSTKDPGYSKYVTDYKNWMAEHDAWEKSSTTPKKVSLDLNSLYNRYSKTVREQGKMAPTKEVPELVSIKRDLQHKLWQGKMNPADKLPDTDWRRVGKITNSIDERLGKLDPELKAKELKYSNAMEDWTSRQSETTVKRFGGRDSRFSEKFAQTASKKSLRSQGPPGGELTMNDLKRIEQETGIPFTDDLTKHLASSHFRQITPPGRSLWQTRVQLAAPFIIAGGISSGKIPPFWAGMIPLAAMMSPRIAAEAITNFPKYGMQAFTQAMRQNEESPRE
jgi:hypothetical protein